MFHEGSDGRFAPSELSDSLRTDAPGSLAGWAAYVAGPTHQKTWSALLHSIRTGENAFRWLHGESVWSWRERHPEEGVVFDQAMASNTRAIVEALLATYDFGRYGTVADIGGGTGALLAAILARHPGVRGTLFDQPHVVAGAPELLAAAGCRRCDIVGGDFFESVPSGTDAYVLKAILHDWEDEEAVQVVRTVHRADRARGRARGHRGRPGRPEQRATGEVQRPEHARRTGRPRADPRGVAAAVPRRWVHAGSSEPFGQDWHVIVGRQAGT